MTINTNLPNNIEVPGTSHNFVFQRAGGALTDVPLTIAMIGAMRSTGTATAGTVYEVSDSATSDSLFGASGELSLMCRMRNQCSTLFQRGPRAFAVPIAESAGVANVKTITATGTATAEGNQIITIAGRTFVVGISLGDAQNTIASKISANLNASAETLPVLVTVATNVVTLTHATKGVNGVDVVVSIDRQVTGCALAIANTVTGTGVTDHAPALAALSPLRYDGIAFANHAAADIAEILTDIAVRWSATSKTWAWYHIGEPGTIGTASALAAAANDKAVMIASFEGCLNTAAEIAVAHAMLVWSRERSNANYDGAIVPLFPPPAATLYTGPEQNTAIGAGLTPFVAKLDATGAIVQNRAKCVRMITTKTTTNSQTDKKLQDLSPSRVGVALAIQIDIASADRFGAETNPNGAVLQDTDTDQQIGDMVAAIMRAEADDNVLRKDLVEADIAATLVQHDGNVIGRDNIRVQYHPVDNLHQLAYEHNVLIGAV